MVASQLPGFDPSFTEQVDSIETSALAPFDWTLPATDAGRSASVEVSIVPADLIAPFIYFDILTQKVYFEGSDSSSYLAGKSSYIDITLTTNSGI